jgi:hypothetical protein
VVGLSIWASQPVLIGTQEIDDLTDKYSDYNHTSNVEVGFDTARITIDQQRDYIEEWFENGLMRDITVYNYGGQIVWQGWVNQIDVSFGNLAATRGPVLSITNQAETKYTPLDNSVYPPVAGTARKTAITYDLYSQAYYGVWHKILSAGEISDDLADQFQATYLKENSLPETTNTLSFGGSGSTPRMVLSCLGYGHWLNAYPVYEDTDTYRTVTAQIQAVLALSPNAIFSTSYIHMAANGLLVPSLEINDKMALEYIKSLVALGDASDNRYTFGVYEDRMVYYQPVPTTILYNNSMSDPAQKLIYNADQAPVNLWDVRPGEWVQTVDFLVGRVEGTIGLRDDPRNLFIESVEYTAPFGLRLNGKKVNTIPQMVAKMGIGQL